MYGWLAAAIVFAAALLTLVRWIEPRFAFYPFPGETQTPKDYGVAFEAVTIDTTDGERLRGWVMRAPNPRAHIVYFHGNGANLSNWAPILTGIATRGYSVLAFDYRGYGLSSGRPSERGLYRDVDAVVKREWIEHPQSAPTIYWGRSLGASMAAYAATVRPPDGLVLESGFPNARAAVRGSALLVILSFFSSYRFPAAEYANRANRPVLVLHGDRDSVIPFQLGRELFEQITAPKQFVTIEGGDHNDAFPPAAEPYWGAIDSFIASLRH